MRQKEQNRTKCQKAGDCEAEEERDGKVLEEPGCHRMGENIAMEMWSVLTLLQQKNGSHNPAEELVGYPRPLSQTVPRLRFLFSDWVSCNLG